MEGIQLYAMIIGAVGGTAAIVGGILGLWLKANLQDLTTAVEVLNNTVGHFVKGQESLKESLDKQEEYARKTRERLISVESKATSAHNRLDYLERSKDSRQ